MITIMRRYGFSLDFLSLWFIYGGGVVSRSNCSFAGSRQRLTFVKYEK